MYDVVLSTSVRSQIKKLPRRYQKSAIEALEELREIPLSGKALARELKGQFSFQFGPYRMIYKIKKREKKVEVLAVRHRKYAYN